MTMVTTPVEDRDDADVWPLARATARFSEVVERALACGPQVITRHGDPAVVVVSHQEWQRKVQRRGTLAEFFAHSPLRDSPDRVVERLPDTPQPPSL